MLADDVLGSTRERPQSPLPRSYEDAFHAIDEDPNVELVVGCMGDDVIAVAQISYTPHLSYGGRWRATVEGVRTAGHVRGRGIGAELMHHLIERARTRGCHMVQLTTDKRRQEAHRFYEKLGFKASHEGMKLHLE